MKNFSALIFLMTISINGLMAQHDQSYWLGTNASVSKGELLHNGEELDGGAVYNGEIGFLFGIGCLRVINDRFDIESGIDFSRNSYNYLFINGLGQLIKSAKPEHVDLLSIPLNIRFKVKKLFFVTAGIQYDKNINTLNTSSIYNQTGIGVNLKIGKDFRITDKMIVYIAPEILIHKVASLFSENNQHRLTEFGLRMSYKFGL